VVLCKSNFLCARCVMLRDLLMRGRVARRRAYHYI
jgi:hypothetical protein